MYCYGKNVVRELLDNQQKINTIYVLKNWQEHELLQQIQKLSCPIKYVEKKELDKMVNGLHQGIIAKVEDYHYHELEEVIDKDNGFLVILDHIEDPHNFGAIIRTAEAAGVDAIIIPKDRSVEVNGTVMKVSVGTLEHVPIIQVTNLNDTIRTLKKNNYWVVGTTLNGEDYAKIDYTGKIVIIIGNEGKGMSDLVMKNCDFLATIPMNGTTNSLNASVATGIVLFEAVKQRR